MKRMWSKNELLRLSDAEIRRLIESGEITNAKPIYFHPIRFDINGNTASQTVQVKSGSIMILNNSSEALDSFTKLKHYLYNNGSNIDILCSIDFFDTGVYAGQILSMTCTGETESEFINIKFTLDGATLIDGALSNVEFAVTGDVVNKIN